MNESMIEVVRDALYEAEANRHTVSSFQARFPELNVQTAYAIQEALIDKKQGKKIGYKLGLTSKAKQQMMNVHEPVYGILMHDMLLDDENTISLESFIHPKIEPELAFIFDRDVWGPGVSAPDILKATSSIMLAFEVIDSRYEKFKFTLEDVICDNASSSKFILGHKINKPAKVDLGLCGMVFRKNGDIITTSTPAAVMGHPARAISWMANALAERNLSIKAGDIVLSGALCEAITIEMGDHFEVSMDGFGSLHARF